MDAVENAEVAEIKRAVFRALTRLRAAAIKESYAQMILPLVSVFCTNGSAKHFLGRYINMYTGDLNRYIK